jgi:large subunit ribosomal protein L13
MVKKIQQKTFLKSAAELKKGRKWYLVDATGCVLGRLATKIAVYLRGKNKPDFCPHLDGGDFVVVVNASKIKYSGKKMTDKIYYGHSGYPEGLKAEPLGKLLTRKPARVLEYAVKGMLPKGRLGAQIIRRLKVYAGEKQPHGVSQLQSLKI